VGAPPRPGVISLIEVRVIAPLAAVAVAVAACAGQLERGAGPGDAARPVAASESEPASEVTTWKARCENGFAVDCRKLGRAHLFGAGVPADDRLAAAFLMKACEIGEPASCSDLGVLTLLGRGVAQDDAAGAALTRRACEAGQALACSNLGTLTIEGVNRPSARPEEVGQGGARIVRAFQVACDAGAAEGCLNLGTAREQRTLVERDLPGAARAYRKGCEGGLPLACHRWALLAAESPQAGLGADAAALDDRACRAGIAVACTRPGQAPGPAGPMTPSPRLMVDRTSFALGIPGAGGFHPGDLVQAPARPRPTRQELRRPAVGQLAGLSEPLRQRLALEPPVGGQATPDEPVELLLRLRRAQLASCLAGERTGSAATELAAFFLVESSGRPGELRTATEPADPGLEACAAEVIGGWSFPAPPGGLSGPHLIGFAYQAAPRSPAPRYPTAGVLRAALKDPGCPERNLKLPPAYRGAQNAITVKLVVDAEGKPILFHALTPAPEPLIAVVGQAVGSCAFTPGVGEDGAAVPLWLTLTVRLDHR
jgi:TPR repeat protein